MDPMTIWQAAIDGLPLLVLRVVALMIGGLALALAACAIGAVACHRVEEKLS